MLISLLQRTLLRPSHNSNLFVLSSSSPQIGTPIVQTLLSKRQLRINGGSKKFSYPSDSDIVVARDRTGACHRYLTVAYGRKNRGKSGVRKGRVREGIQLVRWRFERVGLL